MYLSRSTLLSLLSAPLLAFAANPNPFSIPSSGLSAKGGQPLDLTWSPTTQGTISLILRSGSSDNLAEGTVIASKIQNSGAYTWTPANSLTAGSDYTIEIVDDANPDLTNYTPYFILDTPTTKAYSTSQVKLGAPSSTPKVSTASPTDSALVSSSVSSNTPTGTTSSGFHVPVHNTFTNRATQTTPGSATGSPTGGAAGASASSASSAGAASKATAMAAGIFGVALGALAL